MELKLRVFEGSAFALVAIVFIVPEYHFAVFYIAAVCNIWPIRDDAVPKEVHRVKFDRRFLVPLLRIEKALVFTSSHRRIDAA